MLQIVGHCVTWNAVFPNKLSTRQIINNPVKKKKRRNGCGKACVEKEGVGVCYGDITQSCLCLAVKIADVRS